MNFVSYTTLAVALLFTVVGFVLGAFIYRCFLVKHPSVLNALVSKAKEDIEAVEALITQKRSVLPTAVAAPVAKPVSPVVPVEPVAAPAPVAVLPVVVPAAPVVSVPTPVAPVIAPIAVEAPAVAVPAGTAAQ